MNDKDFGKKIEDNFHKTNVPLGDFKEEIWFDIAKKRKKQRFYKSHFLKFSVSVACVAFLSVAVIDNFKEEDLTMKISDSNEAFTTLIVEETSEEKNLGMVSTNETNPIHKESGLLLELVEGNIAKVKVNNETKTFIIENDNIEDLKSFKDKFVNIDFFVKEGRLILTNIELAEK